MYLWGVSEFLRGICFHLFLGVCVHVCTCVWYKIMSQERDLFLCLAMAPVSRCVGVLTLMCPHVYVCLSLVMFLSTAPAPQPTKALFPVLCVCTGVLHERVCREGVSKNGKRGILGGSGLGSPGFVWCMPLLMWAVGLGDGGSEGVGCFS